MLDLSIIIVNWNTKDLLMKCLQAVFNTAGRLQYEVILVDNASSDGSVEAARKRFPEVRIVSNEENAGFARANNQGIELAQGRYILLLNSDAFVDEGALEKTVELMDAYPDTGVGGCRLYYGDGSLQRSCFSFPTLSTEFYQVVWLDRLFPRSPTFGKYWMTHWDSDDIQEVDSIMGAFMMLRRKAVEEVGLLDESYFMYSEEVDLCYRMKQAGWKVRYFPEATATHLWGGSSQQVPVKTFLRLYQSRVKFFRKHYGPWKALLYKTLLFWGSLVRAVGGYAVLVFRRNPELSNRTHNYRRLLKSISSF